MWYFAWILGIGVALAFGLINALWLETAEKFESTEDTRAAKRQPGRRS
jgi:cyd operon protein YbgT